MVRNLESAGGEVTKDLYDLAMQSSWFKNSRFKGGKGKGVGGAGLGFKERPALGFSGGGRGGGGQGSANNTPLGVRGGGEGAASSYDNTPLSEQVILASHWSILFILSSHWSVQIRQEAQGGDGQAGH